MKAKVIINFHKINGVKVNKELLKKTPQLKEATESTIAILCTQIKKYFGEKKVKTGVTFELEDD